MGWARLASLAGAAALPLAQPHEVTGFAVTFAGPHTRISLSYALNGSTVTEMVKRARNLAAGAFLAISFAALAPLSALACSAGGGSGTSGGSAGTAGGSATITGAAGGGFVNPFAAIDPTAAMNAAVAGFTLLLGLAALSIWVAVVMLRRRPQTVPTDRLSPDGMYLWDGAFWRPVPPH